jgi:Ca-activated chloride channel family protein
VSNDFAGLFISGYEQVPLINVKVISDIVGAGARTTIIQEFRNNDYISVEAVYKFPVPENAAICGFRATVGDKLIRGDIEERNKAFETYDNAMMNGHGAFLLDEERPNIFTLSVGNLKPGVTVIIEIEYVNSLTAHGSEVRYFLPMTISPRYIPTNMEDSEGLPDDELINPPFDLEVPYRMQLTVNIHGKEGITTYDSPSHRIASSVEADRFVVSIADELTEMDRDFVLNITRKNVFGPMAYTCEVAGERFYQIDFVAEGKTANAAGNSRVAQEIIFLLDCSGSMQGSSIEEAKRVITIILKGLEEGTLFNIYRFGSKFEKLFEKGERYTSKQAEQAVTYVSKIEADLGGTEIYLPLLDIYRTPTGIPRSIVLLTDGEVGNEKEVCGLAEKLALNTRLFTIGIGHGPNEYFIRQLARSSKGASELIAPNERIEPTVLRLFKKVMSEPLRIRIKGDKYMEQCPKAPVVYAGDLVSIYGRITADNILRVAEALNVESGDGKQAWQLPIATVKEQRNPIPQLWARALISDLEESTARLGLTGSKQTGRKQDLTRERIIAISKQYGIMSRQTSFIGIEIRADHEKTDDDIVIRRIPVMLTRDWGGQRRRRMASSGKACSSSHNISQSSIRELNPGSAASMDIKSCDYLTQAQAALRDTYDRLILLLDAQRTEGGFAINASLSTSEHWDLKEIRDLARRIKHKGKVNTFHLISTAIVLAVLKSEFSERRDEWERIVAKSEIWLSLKLARTMPTIDGLPLKKWADSYVHNLLNKTSNII